MTRYADGGPTPATREYRWRGVTRAGNFYAGVIELPPSALPDFVKSHYMKGWRELTVCAGPGPNPPRPDEEPVAEIRQHPDTGHRTWYAEQDGT